MPPPANPKIYHIVHVDRLASIATDGWLWCDEEIFRHARPGTSIGLAKIKKRRREELSLNSHHDLYVGSCVPFYFCPRSVMLYMISRANYPELVYRGGQDPIVHLEADLRETVGWAEERGRRWAFTLSGAGSGYFEDRCDLAALDEINWDAVEAKWWSGGDIPLSVKDDKQAEFLVERSFPWELVERIGVKSHEVHRQALEAVQSGDHRPCIEIIRPWYY